MLRPPGAPPRARGAPGGAPRCARRAAAAPRARARAAAAAPGGGGGGANHYEVLGLGPDASADEVKASYRRLAKATHPDVDATAGAAERFLALRRAYDVLSQELLRAEHAQQLGARARAGAGRGAAGGGGAGRGAAGRAGARAGERHARGRGRCGRPRPGPRRGRHCSSRCRQRLRCRRAAGLATARNNDPRFARFNRWRAGAGAQRPGRVFHPLPP
jgi:hypothetical protein